jgi:NADPH:quinone reductase-like Zn-dependent oxidoreductase
VGAPRAPRVLVLGGSGGTGSAAIQLAAFFGADSIATTTSSANFDYCASLGATQLIDYHTENWQDVFEEGYLDVIFDTVGDAGTAADALALLSKSGGRFVTIAGALAPSFQVPAGTTQAQFINSDTNLVSAPLLSSLKDIVDAGGLKMPSVSVYGLDQVSEAFATSAAGHVVGKLVISVTNDTSVMKK